MPSFQGAKASLQARVATVSMPGGRSVNEDRVLVRQEGARLACVLCDGAGGHGGGDLAAQAAADIAVASLLEPRGGGGPDDLVRAIREAHQAVLSRQDGDAPDMRTTIVAAVLDLHSRRACWGHSGDSRLYFLQAGRVVAMTKDHSVVQAMIDSMPGAANAPQAFRGRNALFSALGSAEQPIIDVLDGETDLAQGDALLLCSDGFWEELQTAQLEAEFMRAATPEQWIEALSPTVSDALAHAASRDNYSAIAVWVESAADGSGPP